MIDTAVEPGAFRSADLGIVARDFTRGGPTPARHGTDAATRADRSPPARWCAALQCRNNRALCPRRAGGRLRYAASGTRLARIRGRARRRHQPHRALKAGISQATYFNWKKRYRELLPDEMRRLTALENQNSRLKKIVADLTLNRELLQDVIRRKILKPGRMRELFRGMCIDWGVSIHGGLWRHSLRHFDVPLQVPAHRPGDLRKTDKGDLGDAGSLWLLPRPCPAAARRMGEQHQ